jgi:hypothetical protein
MPAYQEAHVHFFNIAYVAIPSFGMKNAPAIPYRNTLLSHTD